MTKSGICDILEGKEIGGFRERKFLEGGKEVDMEKVVMIIGIILLIGTIALVLWGVYDSYGEYECVDVLGNEIRCINVRMEKSGAWGISSDGRRVQLVSYKKVE